MAQNSNDLSENTVTHGYQISTGVELTDNILTLNPRLSGVGGTAWIFETSDNELIILSFYWGVKPNAIPEISKKYRIANGQASSSIRVNVAYTVHRSKNDTQEESWTQLKGSLEENIKIDITRKYPYMTNIQNVELLSLLDKYNVKIKN